jgi:hypothetical protein
MRKLGTTTLTLGVTVHKAEPKGFHCFLRLLPAKPGFLVARESDANAHALGQQNRSLPGKPQALFF